MEKDLRLERYFSRIREELSYSNYSEVRSLCVKAGNVAPDNYDIKLIREYVELHKEVNGRYERFRQIRYIDYVYVHLKEILINKRNFPCEFVACLTIDVPKSAYGELSYMESINFKIKTILNNLNEYVKECENLQVDQKNEEEFLGIKTVLQEFISELTKLNATVEKDIENYKIRELNRKIEQEKAFKEQKKRELDKMMAENKERRKRRITRWSLIILFAVLIIVAIIVCGSNG